MLNSVDIDFFILDITLHTRAQSTVSNHVGKGGDMGDVEHTGAINLRMIQQQASALASPEHEALKEKTT